ncbi:MAG: hypothetical protein V4750_10555, partial [Pseudomonadota bacterium]
MDARLFRVHKSNLVETAQEQVMVKMEPPSSLRSLPPEGALGILGRPGDAELRINGDRLWGSLMEMARIGATPKGGVCRLTLTDLDKQSRDLFVQWCEAAGCTVKVDQMGNIFARRPGRNNSLAPVGTGSHLDSQPTGGRFDGVYGVLAGLEVIRTLNDHGIETERPVEA